MARGSRYRWPRKFKKAWHASFRGTLTEKQRKLLARALPGFGGWKRVRKQNAHVAMGDTTTLRHAVKRRRKLDECGKPAWRRCRSW